MTSPLDAALRARGHKAPHRDLINPPKLFKVAIDDHEGTVRGPAIEKSSALGAARLPLEAAREFRAKMNELLSTTKDHRDLAKRAAPYFEAITKKFDASLHTLTKLKEAQEREISKQITATSEDGNAAEIRGYFRAAKEPFSEATKLLGSGCLKTTRALLSQPSYLSGMSEEQQSTLRLAARAKYCPDQHALAGDLDKAIAQIQRVGSEFVREVGSALNEWQGANAQAAVDKAFG
jgi:hypothetical protein